LLQVSAWRMSREFVVIDWFLQFWVLFVIHAVGPYGAALAGAVATTIQETQRDCSLSHRYASFATEISHLCLFLCSCVTEISHLCWSSCSFVEVQVDLMTLKFEVYGYSQRHCDRIKMEFRRGFKRDAFKMCMNGITAILMIM
jgi:hypothetical protein